jgi:hypothetical protein
MIGRHTYRQIQGVMGVDRFRHSEADRETGYTDTDTDTDRAGIE